MTSSVHSPVGDLRRTSSPKGEDSTVTVLCAKGLLADIKWSGYRASPLAEFGGVGFVPEAGVDIMPAGYIVPREAS